MDWYHTPPVILDSIIPVAPKELPVIVFAIGNPALKSSDWNTIWAEEFAVRLKILIDALLVLPKTILLIKEKSPVGVTDVVFEVVKVKVFVVVSSTINVSLNSLYSVSAPLRAILSPGEIPWLFAITVTVPPLLEIASVSSEIVFEVSNPKVISVFDPVINVLPVSVKFFSVSESDVTVEIVAFVERSEIN